MLPALLTAGAASVLIALWIMWRRGPNEPGQTFHFWCGRCGQKVRYRADSQGRRIMCPHCLLPCTVPTVDRNSTI
jgi:hypothetical protein